MTNNSLNNVGVSPAAVDALVNNSILDNHSHSVRDNHSQSKFNILDHLDKLTSDGGKDTKREASYHCPVCQAKNFKVDLSTGRYGSYSCDCARTEDGKRKIREAVAPKQKTYTPKQQREWIYTDTANKPTIKLVRFDDGAGTKTTPRKYRAQNGKWLYPYQAEEQGIELKKDNLCDRTTWLYYDELKKAAKSGITPIMVEGEVVADSLRKIGCVATTVIGGCNGWSDRYASELKEAGITKIILSPDRDKPGIEFMDGAADSIEEHGIEVGWLYPYADSGLWSRSLPENGGLDLKDYLEEYPSMTPENLFNQVELARRQFEFIYQQPAAPESSEQVKGIADEIRTWVDYYLAADNEVDRAIAETHLHQRFKISKKRLELIIAERVGGFSSDKPRAKRLSADNFFTEENTGIKWLIPGLLPASGVTVLGGDAGAGKTTMAYDAAASIIYGDPFLGEQPAVQGKVLIVSSDEPINFAQDKMLNRGIMDNFEFLDQWDVSQWELLEETIEDIKPALVLIDSFSSIHNDESFDENCPQAKATIYRLNRILSEYNAGGILIHHLSKSKENKGVNKLRGSSAIAAASSMVWLLEGENDVKRFWQPKTRGTEPLDLKVKLSPHNGIFRIIEGQIYDDETKSLGDRIIALFESLEGQRLEIKEICEQLNVNRDSTYKALERLTKRGMLIKRPSAVNKRCKVWGLPHLEHTPSPESLSKCLTEAENTIDTEPQKLDKHWTDTGQILDDIGQQKCPTSESTTDTEPQKLDRQSETEGGECPDNECPTQEDLRNAKWCYFSTASGEEKTRVIREVCSGYLDTWSDKVLISQIIYLLDENLEPVWLGKDYKGYSQQ